MAPIEQTDIYAGVFDGNIENLGWKYGPWMDKPDGDIGINIAFITRDLSTPK